MAYDKHNCALRNVLVMHALLSMSIVVECIGIALLMISKLCNALGLLCL